MGSIEFALTVPMLVLRGRFQTETSLDCQREVRSCVSAREAEMSPAQAVPLGAVPPWSGAGVATEISPPMAVSVVIPSGERAPTA